jgi:hypothetical protein
MAATHRSELQDARHIVGAGSQHGAVGTVEYPERRDCRGVGSRCQRRSHQWGKARGSGEEERCTHAPPRHSLRHDETW